MRKSKNFLIIKNTSNQNNVSFLSSKLMKFLKKDQSLQEYKKSQIVVGNLKITSGG